jgi:cardiolipin synthase
MQALFYNAIWYNRLIMLSNLSLWAVVTFTLQWVILIAFLLYVPQNRKPSSAIAWLLVIFLLPVVGIILFLVIGSPKLSRRRRNEQKLIDASIADVTEGYHNETSQLTPTEKERYTPLINLCRHLTKLPASAGNKVTILPDYNQAIADIARSINAATEFVHLEYFALALDDTTMPIFDAMESAVTRGVKVRVMFDALGSRKYPRKKELQAKLTAMGVEWHKMLPISLTQYNRPDLRNHRKIVVVDDHTAYIGSQNLVDRTYHRKDAIYYDELVAKMTGPVVRQCSAVFASDWFTETGQRLLKFTDPKRRPLPAPTGNSLVQIVPSGPNYSTENNARLFAALFHTARSKIVITNPYFVPNEAILDAITSAVYRGVEVTLINSEAMDQWMVGHAQRSFYKHITIDDDIAVVGSSNMDIRSFELDLECIMVAYDGAVVKALQKVQKYNLSQTTQLDLKSWIARSNKQELLDSIARLTSSLQ